jgi:hypothetical protein
MPHFTFDARINTNIIVTADNEQDAYEKAKQIFNRFQLTDPESENQYTLDLQDGIEIVDTYT